LTRQSTPKFLHLQTLPAIIFLPAFNKERPWAFFSGKPTTLPMLRWIQTLSHYEMQMPVLPQVVPGDRELYRQQVREIEEARSKERKKKADAKLESKTEPKTDSKPEPESKPAESKTESKPESKTESNPEPTSDTKPETKAAASKTETKPAPPSSSPPLASESPRGRGEGRAEDDIELSDMEHNDIDLSDMEHNIDLFDSTRDEL